MNYKNHLSDRELHDYFHDRLSLQDVNGKGVIVRKPATENHISEDSRRKNYNNNANKIITATNNGYIRFKLDGIQVLGHHVVWVMTHGTRPPEGMDIDHINRVRDDNWPENLRAITRQENCLNRRTSDKRMLYSNDSCRFEEHEECARRYSLLRQGKIEYVEKASVIYKLTDTFSPPDWRTKPLDKKHIEYLKKDLFLRGTSTFDDPLVGVRVSGGKDIYLTDGYHRWYCLKDSNDLVPFYIYEVDNLGEVHKTVSQIAAYINTMPSAKLSKRELLQSIYSKLLNGASDICDLNNSQISKAYTISCETVKKMKTVIVQMKESGIEPSGRWYLDRNWENKGALEAANPETYRDRMIKIYVKDIRHLESYKKIQDDEEAAYRLILEMFPDRKKLKNLLMRTGLEMTKAEMAAIEGIDKFIQ